MEEYIPSTFPRGFLNPLRVATYRLFGAPGPSVFERHRAYFEKNPGVVFSSVQGIGFNGGILIFDVTDPKNPDGPPVDRLSVKFAANDKQDEQLLLERLYLLKFNGAEHMEQIVYVPDTEINFGPNITRSIIVTEYLPHGSLAQVRERATRAGIRIPNNFLWQILRCMVRQCMAMEYAPGEGFGIAGREEAYTETPRNERTKVTHNAINGFNLRLGHYNSADIEHKYCPVIKLTNMSKCRTEEDTIDAYNFNVRDMGRFIQEMALNLKPLNEFGKDKSNKFMARNEQLKKLYPQNLWANAEITTSAHEEFLADKGIDPALRELVARCMSENMLAIPGSKLFMALVQDGCQRTFMNNPDFPYLERRTETFFGEEDRFIKDYILNADVSQGILGDITEVMGFATDLEPYEDLWSQYPETLFEERTLFQGFQERNTT